MPDANDILSALDDLLNTKGFKNLTVSAQANGEIVVASDVRGKWKAESAPTAAEAFCKLFDLKQEEFDPLEGLL